jgi:uncharacterized membrane protein
LPLRTVAAALGLAWPLALHAAALSGRPEVMPWITAGATGLVALLLAAATRRPVMLAGAAAIAAAAAGVAVAWPRVLLFAPPVLINFAFAAFFATSLAPGRDPVISRYARRERGTLEPDLARYTRTLTVLWAVFLAAMGIVAAILAVASPLAVWSLFCNVISYALVATFLLGEYAYRRLRFRHYRHASLAAFLRNVARGRPSGTH